jgi:hypothetical protein
MDSAVLDIILGIPSRTQVLGQPWAYLAIVPCSRAFPRRMARRRDPTPHPRKHAR